MQQTLGSVFTSYNFQKIVHVPVVVLEDPNLKGFAFIETGILNVLPDGGRGVTAAVVKVNVGKSEEWVNDEVNEFVVTEETAKLNDVLEEWEDEAATGCSVKIKASIKIISYSHLRNVKNVIKIKK